MASPMVFVKNVYPFHVGLALKQTGNGNFRSGGTLFIAWKTIWGKCESVTPWRFENNHLDTIMDSPILQNPNPEPENNKPKTLFSEETFSKCPHTGRYSPCSLDSHQFVRQWQQVADWWLWYVVVEDMPLLVVHIVLEVDTVLEVGTVREEGADRGEGTVRREGTELVVVL